MNDPRQPLPAGAPRPAAAPHAPAHAPQHPPQHAQPHAPQAHPPGMMPQARPVARPMQQPAQQPAHPAHPTGPAKIAPMPSMPMAAPSSDDDAIALIEDGEDATTLHKKIKAFGDNGPARVTKWTRQPAKKGDGPVRVRTFHAKLSDQGLEYLDDAINHFIDDHPEVDIKFVTTNVGMFDGKFKDLALIVNVWY